MTVREARDSLGGCVDAAHYANEFTIITKHGERRAVIVPYETFESLRAGAAGADVGQTAENR